MSSSRTGPKRRQPTKKICRGADKVHVLVRVRPFSQNERGYDDGSSSPLLCDDVAHTVDNQFAFDRVFNSNAHTNAVFAESILPTVDSWLEGYNGCVFAYGQTGSGKTHTMLGPDGGKKNLDGIIPQAVKYALDRVQHEERQAATLGVVNSQFRIRASYVEVYNDELRDLLGDGSETLSIRESQNGVVFVQGCKYETVREAKDVISLIDQGSRRRATGRTNMNEHSSRSHAVFGLHLEHRWRDDSCAASGNTKLYKMKTAILNMIDLAGSEYANKTGNEGSQLKESIAINTGLFALGNVIAALAGHRDRRVGDHIPYRDSILTRLLQSSLGGDSRTVMVACVSPAAFNRQETLGTLRYAASARSITNKSVLHIEDFQGDPEPLDNDLADMDEDMNRRTVWIETECAGDVYARCMGDESDELVLFVHGSGPTNSSTWWNGIMYELYLRSSRPLFLVAIDCPGYGKTTGDRQTIRSYPGTFLMDVVRALGKKEAFCLVGSSQGACAVFNAVLEYPRISRHVTVMDPVGHDVFRYSAIKQPCLLIFDTEDAGHPVKVGRWMKENIPDCTYFEFAASKEPYWHCDHMVPEMVRMFNKTWSSSRGGGGGGGKHQDPAKMGVAARLRNEVAESVDTMTRLAGGLIAWVENMGFGQPIKQIDEGLLMPPSTFIHEQLGEEMVRQLTVSSDTASTFSGAAAIGTEWRAEVCNKTGRVYYTCDETLEVLWRRPTKGVILNEGDSAVAATGGGGDPATASQGGENLFAEEEEPEKPVGETEDEKMSRLEAELQETVCCKCGKLLWEPRRMKLCRHVVCSLCYNQETAYTGKCCVCGAEGKADPVNEEHQIRLTEHPDATTRAMEIAKAATERSRQLRVVIEYGNTAEGTPGSAYSVEAYAKIAKVERGLKCPKDIKSGQLARVDFNINPDYPKSAVKVSSPPFTLARTMALAFTCEMTVHFASATELPPIVIPYRIHHAPKTARKIVLIVEKRPADVSPPPKSRKPVSIVVDHEEGIVVKHYV